MHTQKQGKYDCYLILIIFSDSVHLLIVEVVLTKPRRTTFYHHVVILIFKAVLFVIAPYIIHGSVVTVLYLAHSFSSGDN